MFLKPYGKAIVNSGISNQSSHSIELYITQNLRDARKEGRLREEITDQAKEGTGKLRVLWNKYGFVAIGTYFCIYVTTLLSCFVFYDSGLVATMPAGTETIIENVSWLAFA